MPKRVLEIGTGSGDGTLLLAASPDVGLLITMEADPQLAVEARRRFAEAGLVDRVSVIVGEPSRFLHKLRGPFDLIVLRQPDDALRTRLQGLLAPEGVLLDGDTKYSE